MCIYIYLTLTNVVFEYKTFADMIEIMAYLTLTNVVFECRRCENVNSGKIFNFNKCCIWIANSSSFSLSLFINLTLTNVVFEFRIKIVGYLFFPDLTLTNVVFE